jgi:hypothetical protein
MNITVADERVLLFPEQIKLKDAETIAWDKKLDAFGAINKVTSFLNRPKNDDFELIYTEHRYQPFWHIKGHSRYVYDRSSTYQVPTHGPEVKSLTFLKTDFAANDGHFSLSTVEHCIQDESEDIFVDGLTSEKNPSLKTYLDFQAKEYTKDTLPSALPKNALLVPPQARASAIVREAASKMMHNIQADQIFEEHIDIDNVDLYYRPVYAFQFKWMSKGKDATIEVDALTSEVRTGKTFKEYLGKMVDVNFLFDIGADAAGMFIPGGSIAVKLAKKAIDHRQHK